MGKIKHGLAKHPLYAGWYSMKQRCYNSNLKQYKDWGGKGIMICDEWKYDVEKFINWALNNGYKNGLLIDRIDNDGNYEPNNVRFVDHGLSNRNQRLLKSTNTSGYRGVCWHKKAKKWMAYISINNKCKNLGYFINKIDAALKYNDFARELNDGRPINFI